MRNIPIVAALVALLLVLSGTAFAIPPAPWEADELLGNPAPDFTLPDMEGKQVSLSQFRGTVVLINFWATWCPPCRKEMPSLNRLLKQQGAKGIRILSIAADRSLARLERFVQDEPLDFPVLRDPDNIVAGSFKVYALPTTFLISRDGKVLEKFLGERNWDRGEAVKKILAAAGAE